MAAVVYVPCGTGVGVGVGEGVMLLYRLAGLAIATGNRVERSKDAIAERCAALRCQAVDRGENGILVVRRRLHRKAAIAESDDADLHGARLAS